MKTRQPPLCRRYETIWVNVSSNDNFEKEQNQETEFVGVHFLVSLLRYPRQIPRSYPDSAVQSGSPNAAARFNVAQSKHLQRK